MKTPEERRAISLRLIQEAKADLSKGNYQEAGQKTWGAVVQHLKVIGENRGWNHASDRLLEDVGWQMRAEYSGHESAALADGLSEAYTRGQNTLLSPLDFRNRMPTFGTTGTFGAKP